MLARNISTLHSDCLCSAVYSSPAVVMSRTEAVRRTRVQAMCEVIVYERKVSAPAAAAMIFNFSRHGRSVALGQRSKSCGRGVKMSTHRERNVIPFRSTVRVVDVKLMSQGRRRR